VSPSTSEPQGEIEFISFHQPGLLDGDYELTAKQQVRIDGSQFGWGTDQWSAAPSAKIRFSVAGPRFAIDASLVRSQFPPPKSLGEYYNVLPHVILGRSTLAWERTIDGSTPSSTAKPRPWLALVLFDKVADGLAPALTTVTVQDLLTTYAASGKPAGQPEFVRVLPRDASGAPSPGELKLENGQHLDDRLQVIDVPKKLLARILPSEAELPFLAHVRQGDSPSGERGEEFPVVFCARLPGPGKGGVSPVGTESTVHLVSLEARKPLLDELLAPGDDELVRLVSLASWSFSTLQRNKTFSTWVKDAWCPAASRTDPPNEDDPSACATGELHTLRLPRNDDQQAEAMLAQGYAPIRHQTRQGNRIVSWYRGPLVPGDGSATPLDLPVRSSDQLVRYLSDLAMFDTSYAAAWELGRALTLRSKSSSVALFQWKRSQALRARQAEASATHLPFGPAEGAAPDFPAQWFEELLALEHVPFHYLVPLEDMLPSESLRFFSVDLEWVRCLLDGAFSVGRTSSADLRRDHGKRQGGVLPEPRACGGFLLRSHVVSGWPHLGVEAYTRAIPTGEAANYVPSVPPARKLRMARLGEDILLCLFEGDVQAVDIHEHPEAIHFGVDLGSPEDRTTYYKDLRGPDGRRTGVRTPIPWRSGTGEDRTVDVGLLAAAAAARNSAALGVAMIEGVEKVRLLKRTR